MCLIRPLPKELQEIAKKELNEDPSQIEESLAILKNWILKTPHLKARTDDQFLLAFLRGCKFSVEKAKSKIDGFYSVHTAMPEIFANRRVNDRLMFLLKLKAYLPLPTPDANGNRVILIRHIPYDEVNTTPYEAISVVWMFEHLLMNEDDNAVVNGIHYVIDVAQFTMKDAGACTPTAVKKISFARKIASPIRLKRVNLFNAHSLAATIFNLAKGFADEKIRARMSMHGSLDKLCEHFPQELLPAEYGGKAGTMDEINEKWIQKFKDYEQYFEEDSKFGTDESLRIGKARNADDLFGAEGSFRKLEVD